MRRTRDPRRTEILREARILGAAALLILVLVALLAYDPAEPPGGLVGRLGQWLAGGTFWLFGLTAFLLIPLALYWLGLGLFRRGMERNLERGGGLLLVVLAVSAGLALTVATSRFAPLQETGPGGILGLGVKNGLVWALGSVGAFLAVVIFFLLGLALFTDWLVFEMAAEGMSAARGVGPWAKRVLWPDPVVPAAGAKPAEPKPAAAEVKVEKAVPVLPPILDPVPDLSPAAKPAPAAAPEPKAKPKPEPAPITAEPKPAPVPELPKSEPEFAVSGDVVPPKPRASRKKAAKPAPGVHELPPLDLLDAPRVREIRGEEESIQKNARLLEETLGHFKVDARVVGFTRGPVVTMYELTLAAGIKASKIQSLSDDLSIALKAPVRVVAPLPGKSTVGVEVPNVDREDVRLKGLLETDTYRKTRAALPMLLGVDASGAHRVEDLTAMPHLLIAGATGSGKSVCINSIIMSVLMTRGPDDVRFILVDPKQVELSFFSRIPHLLAPVVTDMKRAVSVLEWVVSQMEERYDLLAMMQVRNIAGYNELGAAKVKERVESLGEADREIPPRLPYFIVVVDELADLMMTAGKDIEVLITRLAQKSRAVGIHVVLATSARPRT